MPYYRFFFTDAERSIVGHVVLELDDDASAQLRADSMLVRSIYPGIEVWDCARLFYRKMRNEGGDG